MSVCMSVGNFMWKLQIEFSFKFYRRLAVEKEVLFQFWKSFASTDLHKYSPDAVPPIHAVSYHVATDKPPPRPRWRQVPVYFSNNLQQIATRGKKARGTLLVNQHCGNGCSIKRAPLSVSYYNEISGGHIGRAVLRRRCSAGPVLPLWIGLLSS